MWIPPEEKDPIILHNPTRKSIGYFGAVKISDGQFVYQREADKFNAVSFHKFIKKLKKISRQKGKKAIIISDNARYHHANLHKEWRNRNKRTFSLFFLPPYSPELNPIERVWKLTRRLRIHNKYFSSLDNVITEVEKQFKKWKFANETLRKLCAIN